VKYAFLIVLISSVAAAAATASAGSSDSGCYPEGVWDTVNCTGEPHARHEAAFVGCNEKLYLLGGRRVQPVDELDPRTGEWRALAAPPLELHHFQAIEREGKIWMMGAMTGRFPGEKPLPNIYIFDPAENTWTIGPEIPESRRRGGAGVVQYAGKIYMVGGITNGHIGGYVPWLDLFDPETGKWEVLKDAPHARDHFQAAVIEGKLYAAGGRRTSKETNQVFSLTVAEVDVYDFANGEWTVLDKPLPTPRAGTSSIAINGCLVVAGGESDKQDMAFQEVEAYSPQSGHWFDWPFLKRGRHGTGLAVIDGKMYTSSGSGNRGGRPELTTPEVLVLEE
jgi:hypothetical protein